MRRLRAPLLMMALLAACAPSVPEPSPPARMPVPAVAPKPALRVVDGDTIAWGRERWRLVGYDAPESHRPRCAAEARLGAAAKRRLAEVLRGAGSLDYARVGRDRYGRTLIRLYADERDVAEIMIAEGLGRAYDGGRRQSWC